jgi:cellobiose phosphorylase
VGLEGILGLEKRGDTLFVTPRAPSAWPEYTIEYRHGASLYVIVVRSEGTGEGLPALTIDGAPAGPGIPLVDDGRQHAVVVRRAERTELETAQAIISSD